MVSLRSRVDEVAVQSSLAEKIEDSLLVVVLVLLVQRLHHDDRLRVELLRLRPSLFLFLGRGFFFHLLLLRGGLLLILRRLVRLVLSRFFLFFLLIIIRLILIIISLQILNGGLGFLNLLGGGGVLYDWRRWWFFLGFLFHFQFRLVWIKY